MSDDPIARVRDLNATAFADVLRSHPGILIRAEELRTWRPCRQSVTGTITGLEHLGTLTPLCTDGTVAWFLGRSISASANGRRENTPHTILHDTSGFRVESFAESVLLHGHVKNFVWNSGGSGAPPQPFSVEGGGKTSSSSGPKARKEKPSAFSEAMTLLKDLFS